MGGTATAVTSTIIALAAGQTGAAGQSRTIIDAREHRGAAWQVATILQQHQGRALRLGGSAAMGARCCQGGGGYWGGDREGLGQVLKGRIGAYRVG
jgi:hypothetical protein